MSAGLSFPNRRKPDESMKLTHDQISALIEERYIERGRAYVEAGLLELTEVTPARVTARCAGTKVYRVTLTLKGKRLSGDCTCPAFDEFGPCKHMAATGLAVMAQANKGYTPGGIFLARKKAVTAIERKLMRMSKAELIELIMDLVPDEADLKDILNEGIE
jgi:uncharacterized Zn finger protein